MNQADTIEMLTDEKSKHTYKSRKINCFYADFAKVVSISSVLVAIPFSIYHLMTGNSQVAIIMAPVIMLQTYLAYYFSCKGYNQKMATALVFMQLIGSICLVIVFGQLAVIWLFVTGVTSYFLLPVKVALVANTFATVVIIMLGYLEPFFLVRFLAAYTIFNICLYVFSRQLVERTNELELMLTIDPLTRAGNRTSLELALNRIKSQADRHGLTATLMVIDIDNFSRYNEDLGPLEADELLRNIAEVIKHRLRPTDSFYRYHGEEFVLIAENTPMSQATYLAEDIRKRVEKRIDTATVSIGVTDMRPGIDVYDALKRAKDALANAHAIGPNWVCFDTGLAEAEVKQDDLWQNLGQDDLSHTTATNQESVR